MTSEPVPTPPPAIRRESHYVPRAYMRRWSPDGSRVWAYRTLVPRADYRQWELRSLQGIARRRDLYTSLRAGQESDRIERWLNEEVEIPGDGVLARLFAGHPLRDPDRRPLARYIAALAVRGPVGYTEHTSRLSRALEENLDPMLRELMADVEGRLARGEPLPAVPHDPEPFPGLHVTLRGKLSGNDPDAGEISVQATVGRAMWLRHIEHIVDEISRLLEPHDWRVFRPHAGWSWFTSDDPVVRLRRHANGTYDFEGRWGDRGTEVFLPLSPQCLLYTRVGDPLPSDLAFGIDETVFLHRVIAQHAHRWVIAVDQPRRVSWFRPRRVDQQAFAAEEAAWESWHDAQSEAERGR